MTDAELITRLRSMSPRLDMLDCENVLTAADRIEALIAERVAAEAKLAKVVEALGCIRKIGLCSGSRETARATLAEIKGESHE